MSLLLWVWCTVASILRLSGFSKASKTKLNNCALFSEWLSGISAISLTWPNYGMPCYTVKTHLTL